MTEPEFVCISCKKKVIKSGKNYHCHWCGRQYPIVHGIPIFLPDELINDHFRQQVQYFTKEVGKYVEVDKVQPWQTKYISRMFKYIHITKNMMAVDDGCGSGYVVFALARKGAIVYACDINLVGLQRITKMAKRLGLSDNVIPVCCSSEYLPIPGSSVAAIIINSVLEHVQRDSQAASEIVRVARRNATVMVTVPISYRFVSRLLLPMHIIYDKKLGHIRRYTEETLYHMFPKWQKLGVYYSGHTKKALKTIVNSVVHLFDEELLELEDATCSHQPMGSTNITMFLKRK